jgi:hypothetical protein
VDQRAFSGVSVLKGRGRPTGAGSRARRVLRMSWWVAMPVWSMGLLAWGPFLRCAFATRRRRDVVVALVYLALSAAELVFADLGGPGGPGTGAAQKRDSVVGGLIGLALIGGGFIHAWVVTRRVEGTTRVLRRPRRPVGRARRMSAKAGRISRRELDWMFDDVPVVRVRRSPAWFAARILGGVRRR